MVEVVFEMVFEMFFGRSSDMSSLQLKSKKTDLFILELTNEPVFFRLGYPVSIL